MVSIITNLLILFSFIITGRLSLAHPLQDHGNASKGCNAVSTGELTDTAAKENHLEGRKMVAMNYMKRIEKVKTHMASGGTSKISSAAQKLQEEGASNVKGKLGIKIDLHSKEIDVAAGYVAFNADYHAPKHHPPKNN